MRIADPLGASIRNRRMNRRTFLKLGAGIAALGAGAAALVRPARANAYYSGPVSDHFDGRVFFNPGGDPPRGFGDFLKWRFGEPSVAWPEALPSSHPSDMPPPRVGGDRLRVSFIGHASFLVQAGGLNILLDPHFSNRASPVGFAGPKRINPPGMAFEALPKIDVVLVSHNHYDHMDLPTLHRLWDRDRPRIFTPLGNSILIRGGREDLVATEGDWGDDYALSEAVSVQFEPAQHWSARGIADRRHALWASFVIRTPWGKLWFAGDTGFGDGRVFRALAARHPDLRLGLIPIGAYEPRWFMKTHHINPADAAEIFRILDLETAIGYHWGTFRLTNEGAETPRDDLALALKARGIARDRFVAAMPGMVFPR